MLCGLSELVLPIRLFDTCECVCEFEFRENAAGDQKTDAVGSGPIGEAVLHTISLQLVAVSRTEDLVAVEFGRDDLADNVFIGEANDQAVFGCIVFVLRLSDETLAGIIVGLALSTTLVFGLVAAVLM